MSSVEDSSIVIDYDTSIRTTDGDPSLLVAKSKPGPSIVFLLYVKDVDRCVRLCIVSRRSCLLRIDFQIYGVSRHVGVLIR